MFLFLFSNTEIFCKFIFITCFIHYMYSLLLWNCKVNYPSQILILHLNINELNEIDIRFKDRNNWDTSDHMTNSFFLRNLFRIVIYILRAKVRKLQIRNIAVALQSYEWCNLLYFQYRKENWLTRIKNKSLKLQRTIKCYWKSNRYKLHLTHERSFIKLIPIWYFYWQR